MMSSVMLVHTTTNYPKSRIRRKPAFTYKSPSPNDVDPPITPPARRHILSQSSRQISAQSNTVTNSRRSERSSRRKIQVGSYSLPLYHPLGELALSLPPLNPADFGLPLPNILEATTQGSPGRPHQLPTKARDADEEGGDSVPTVSSIAAVAANEVKRASPRKKRVGGGNGKRRRRDGDDGDATYPAKRTRQTRAGGDDNDFDDTQGQGDGDGTPEVDGPAERRPERRSTRSRAKRRESSEIESVEGQPTQSSVSPTEENIKQSALRGASEGASEEKEEGEVGER